MPTPQLTPEQEANAQLLAAQILKVAQGKILEMTRLLASKPDHQVLGPTEFQLRDLAHQIAAEALQAEVNERQKKATKAPA